MTVICEGIRASDRAPLVLVRCDCCGELFWVERAVTEQGECWFGCRCGVVGVGFIQGQARALEASR